MLSASRTWIGVVVAVAGNVTISLALNCQKLAHTRLQHAHQGHPDSGHASTNDADGHAAEGSASSSSEDVQSHGEHSRSTHRHHNSDQDDSRNTQNGNQKLHKDHGDQIGHNGNGNGNGSGNGNGNSNGMDTMFLHSKLWWLGLALMTVGEAGNFISYGFAPASLVAPLGAVALLSNVIISPILLGERFKPSDIGGILLAIIGAVTVVFSSKQNDVRLDPTQLLQAIKRLEFVIYSAVSVSSGVLLAFLSTTSLGDRWVLIDVGTCAIFGGFTVLSTKGISSLISGGQPIEALKFPITYMLVLVLAATAVVQITYLNRALQRFDSREVIPAQFVFFTISAIVGSAILYRDFENMDAHRLINFLFGCLTTFAGVFVLTWRSNGSGEHGEEEEQEQMSGSEEEGLDATAAEEGGEGGEAEPLLSRSWHGAERFEDASPHGKKKGRTRVDFLQPAFEEGRLPPSNALRVPGGARQTSSGARPRSRTNSPHKASARLSGSFERASGLSRSATNQASAGLLSSSSSAGLRTPKLSLISMDRPTGLSAGHYLLLATPPPSFSLNPVPPVATSRSGLSRAIPQYGATGNKGGPSAFLPLPVTMATSSSSSGRNASQSSQQQPSASSATIPQGDPTAAESIVTPVAETTAVNEPDELAERFAEHVSPAHASRNHSPRRT
ncbi:DUF803 domain membrane protein [Moesziomyces antarcticus]|uniref:Uncharacterized protein n=2 Tax=Pseudozyma antarctica TaxID=84753 RepID=A0A5C3FMK8_PSEA2|nr:DUF803 domain membrane protein [Moesziomyces antarcticus]GAK64072.1 DUF803 domain membrane protein [Moesziomyces antarcticus]SPO44711.1 uncharacterized protein PSANT_02397 [Moesziomyces antarcticus]